MQPDHIHTERLTAHLMPPRSGEAFSPGVEGLLAALCTLGSTVLAPQAGRADAEGRFPAASLTALRDAGLLRLALQDEPLPRMLAATTCAVAEAARHCASTALGLGMHWAAGWWVGSLAGGGASTQAGGSRLRAYLAEAGEVWTLPLADLPGGAPKGAAPGILARRVQGGHLLHGAQPGVVMAGVADRCLLACTPDRPGATARHSLLLAVDLRSAGVAWRGAWDPLGLRGLSMRELVLQDVFVPATDVLLPEGAYAPLAADWPHLQLLALAPAMGLAEAACAQGLAWLRGAGTAAAPRRDAVAHQAAARLQILLGQARAQFQQAVAAIAPDPQPAQRQALLVAQHLLPRQAQALCALALQAGGTAALQRTQPMERLLRDACSLAALLPCHPGVALEQLGRACLDGEADRPPEADVW